MADQRDDIIRFIQLNGPVLPVQIAKHVNTNILFASAMLSELVSRKTLKISHASVGGSPLYYLPGQEGLMDERLSKYLGGREKQVYLLLKEKKVLREKDLEPWQRIAVKSINDFSVAVNVKEGDAIETFWKYHLVSNEEIKPTIQGIMQELYANQQQVQEIVNSISSEETQNIIQPQSLGVKQQELMTPNEVIQEIKVKPQIVKEDTNSKVEEFTNTFIDKPKETKREPKKIDTRFYNKVVDFIKDNKVEVLKEEVVKKDKEFNFVVNILSNFGKLRHLIIAKNKTAINEADISMAFSEGQLRKMPVILFVNGKANKKALALIEHKMQGQLTLKEI